MKKNGSTTVTIPKEIYSKIRPYMMADGGKRPHHWVIDCVLSIVKMIEQPEKGRTVPVIVARTAAGLACSEHLQKWIAENKAKETKETAFKPLVQLKDWMPDNWRN